MADLAIILTVRSDSERFKDKCFFEIKGKPLIYWIIQRLKRIKNSQVVLATTLARGDERLLPVAEQLKIPVYRGSHGDVVGRIDAAMRQHASECKLVLRALADMPFLSRSIVERATEVLLANPDHEAMLWHQPPDIWPVYGAREFPFSRAGWHKIARHSDGQEREHSDMWFHRNRRRFKILYHQPPDEVYFRPYRLEVDYPEDGELFAAIGEKIGMTKPLRDIISFLDQNPEIAALNREKVEKTGPLSSYQYQQQRIWWRNMVGQPVLGWDDRWWRPNNDQQNPVFCRKGHLLGFAQYGTLYTPDGKVQLEAGKIKCQAEGCGAAKYWELRQERRI